MIVPLVKIAQDNMTMFVQLENKGTKRSEGARTDVLPLHFDIPEDHLSDVLDWSYSNGKKLFEIGYRSALTFLEADGKVLTSSMAQY